MTGSEIITIACTVVSTLLGVWGIVHQAFRRRDNEIKQLLKSEQEFKGHKEHSNYNFVAFSKQLNTTEEKLYSTLDRIDRKLDKQDEMINKQGNSITRFEERIKSIK